MLTIAQNPADMFEDIPLDNRHWKVKSRPKFPEEWRLTEERKKELEAFRNQGLAQDRSNAGAEVGLLGEGGIPEAGHGQQPVDERVAVPVRSAPRTRAGV